jgi:hypothetical protein
MDKRALEAYILKQEIDSHKDRMNKLEVMNENLKNLHSPQMIEELIKKEKNRILTFNGFTCEESTLKNLLGEMHEMLEAKEEIYKQLTSPSSFEPPEKKPKFEFSEKEEGGKKYIGVVRNGSKWRLQLRYKGAPIQMCGFATAEEAAREYDQAKVDLWGETCTKLNFMENMSEYLKNKSKIIQVQGILYDRIQRSP